MFQVFAIITSVDLVSSNGCVLVICPLQSIIRDQIEEADSLALNAVELESPGILENLPRLPDIYCICLAAAVCAEMFFRGAIKKRPDVHLVIVDESHRDVGRRNLERTYIF